MRKDYKTPVTRVYAVSPFRMLAASTEPVNRGFAVDGDYDDTYLNEDESNDEYNYNVWKQQDDGFINID